MEYGAIHSSLVMQEDQELYQANPDLFKAFSVSGSRIDIVKAAKSGKMIIEGECSNQTRDMDGEVIITKGIDLSYAEREGKLIWGHTPPPEINAGILPPQFVLGNLIELKPFSKALYLQGMLFNGNENAEQVYRTMKENPGCHGIGFSIEGGAIRRDQLDKSVIVKSWLKNVSMYHNVKNLSTWADVVEQIEKAYGAGAFAKAMDIAATTPLRREDLASNLTRQTFPGVVDVSDPGNVDIKKDDEKETRAKIARLKEYFERDPKTGKIRWKGNSFGKAYEYFVKEGGLSQEEALDVIRMVKSRVIAMKGR